MAIDPNQTQPDEKFTQKFSTDLEVVPCMVPITTKQSESFIKWAQKNTLKRGRMKVAGALGLEPRTC